jgi:hypothetical protein
MGTTAWDNRSGAGLPPNPDVPVTADSPILWSITGVDFSNFVLAADRDRVFHWLGNGDFAWLDPAVDTKLVFRTAWQAPIKQTSTFLGTNYFGVAWLTGIPIDAAPLADVDVSNENVYEIFQDQSEPGSDQKFVRGIWGTATNVLFVGDEGHIYSYSVGPEDFERVTSPTDAALWGVWGSGPGDVWIVGDREVILHGAMP